MTTTTKKDLLISYSIGYGYGKEIQHKKIPIEMGIIDMMKTAEKKYGLDIKHLINQQKKTQRR